MKVKAKAPTPKRGRPRAFNEQWALDAALKVFWKKGYEGASLDDLTAAMGINRPSLYAAFGNKEALFRKALDRYDERAVHARDALNEPTARKVVERLLYGGIEIAANPRNPRGCLMVQTALSCGDAAEPIRRELCARRAAREAELRERFERAQAEGDLPPDSDPADLARFVNTIIQGMSVQSSSGATPEQLHRIADTAMRAWPTQA
ncbi:MAG: TetR/AcrR family transcriptional regulator [Tepidisphaeraceae bacterium]